MDVQKGEVPSLGRIVGATLLIGGTCIGGGMLVLPVATGVAGFVPSLCMMLLAWVMMTLSGLLFVEVSLWLPPGAHVISMTKEFLGRWGQALAWVLYLFISYASIIAYTNGVGGQMSEMIGSITGLAVTANMGSLIFLLVFTSAIFFGNQVVGQVNTLLFFAMLAAYIVLVCIGIPEIKPGLLNHSSWAGVGLAIPLLLTSFSFQAIVPSMTPYLHSHRNSLRIAIVGGTTISLSIYLLWELLVLGTVPVGGEFGLTQAYINGEPATEFFRQALGSPIVSSVAAYFAFFALVTSFLGMTLGLYDFLADGLKIKKEGMGKLFLGLLIILPTYYCASNFARIFLVAVSTSGGFGDAMLNGIMPVMMVWIGRYHRKLGGKSLVPGGRVMLVWIVIFNLIALGLEVAEQLGFIGVGSLVTTLD